MTGCTILCLGTRRWDSLWRSTQQTMSRLARDKRVIYFEPGRDPDRPYLAEARANWQRFLRPRARVIHDNLIVVPTPPPLPYARRRLPIRLAHLAVPLAARANAAVLRRQVGWAKEAFGVVDPILWLYDPRHLHLVGTLQEALVVYHNYDDMHDFPGNERLREVMLDYDRRLARVADAVFVPSQAMYERHRRLGVRVHLIPNAADFPLFHQALAPQTELAPELAALPRPIFGYAGWLGAQIDVGLLIRVAEAHPTASLALVGPDALPAGPDRDRLRALPNVHFLGPQPRQALPAFLKGFEVALIPYRLEGYTLVIYPLKLHEYLAAGRAVVATALPELRRHADVLRIADSPGLFVAALAEAARDYAPERVATRVELARENSWERRVAEIGAILESRWREKKGGNGEDGDRIRFVDALQPTD